MHSKPVLSLTDIHAIIQAARGLALAQQWAVSIAVADDGGHLLAFERLDGCPPISAYIAQEKARSAALGQRETKRYEELVNGGRTSFLSAPLVTALEGGVPIVIDGQVIGAVGVSGVTSEQDAQIAKTGIRALAGQT